ncbi:MAG: tripeptide aminopeptidase [Acidobacteriota bacterium]|jgi:tripeptide aminopeptidase
MKTSALERFLRYVTIDTRSDEHSATTPSTPGQWVLLRLLESELKEIGLADVSLDQFGYVMATIPATVSAAVQTIGFVAHVDTSPEMPGDGVKPIVHSAYDGRDLVLPDDSSIVLRAADNPDLLRQSGNDIVTASGLTLLGADDKAGVAEIVAAAEQLVRHPDIPHGPIRIAFTPDEEIGRGADHFDVARFCARCAYTLDGGGVGELEYESFSADAVTLTFNGFNTHPGYARGRMVNAIRVAADFIARLPRTEMSPETTDGYQGYLHPYQVHAAVDRTRVKVLLRDFATAELAVKARRVEQLAREVVAAHPGASFTSVVEESYRNMREVLEQHPQVVEYARDAIRRAGLEPVERPIRGGTDGSRLSFMGLPTPNLFAGEHNFHSRLEWVSAQDMDKAVEVIVRLCERWAE